MRGAVQGRIGPAAVGRTRAALGRLGIVGLTGLALAGSAHGQASVPSRIHCTPTTVEILGERTREEANPIARALEVAGPGTVIILDPGDYPGFTIGMSSRGVPHSRTSGGAPGNPIIVEGRGRVRILGNGDTIGFDQRQPNGHITFRNLTIVPGERAGLMFYRQSGETKHTGYAFEDCHVLGTWDHLSASGDKSKWGVIGHSLDDFRFVGTSAPARIEKIRGEHAFYIQNHRGPILIENVHARELGRTFCQFTARENDGAIGRGDITIRGCVVNDVCIAAGDAYKGGSAFTFAGRLDCTILLERNVYRAGFDKPLRALTLKGRPYGTGALVAWQGKESVPNRTLILRDNQFVFADGAGDRAVVAIGGTQRILIVGENEFRSGGAYPALSLDPVGNDGKTVGSANGAVYVAPLTRLQGDVSVRGERISRAELARLGRPEAESGD